MPNSEFDSPLIAPVGADTPSPAETSSEETGKISKIIKNSAWVGFGIICLILFTLLKLPEDKIRGYIQGSINQALANQGISLSAAESSVSIGLGIGYTMKQVVINFPPPKDPVKVDQITVSPSILSLLTGKLGGSAHLLNKGSELIAHFSFPIQPKPGSQPINLTADAHQLDLGALGVFPMAAGVQGSAIVNGNLALEGDLSNPSGLSGHSQLQLSKIVVDAQSVMGFSLPRLAVADGKADVTIDNGKLNIRTLQLGKASNPNDDVHADFTGSATLGRLWPLTTLNMKVDFGLSQNVLKALPLIDALLGAGKKPDGSYSYSLNGPIGSLMPVPNK
ncbi:MAG: type II secretion system protein GspN [Oligoflexia bacterium]|nr:type II secretion system protein GspN [Oligoflexia bacterium]